MPIPQDSSVCNQLYSRKNPAFISISERILLTKPESTKKTFHLVLDIQNTAITFKPGDAIAIYPENDPLIALEISQFLQQDLEQQVYYARSNKTLSLYELLIRKVNTARLTSHMLKTFCAHTQNSQEKQRLEELLHPQSKEHLNRYLTQTDLIDFLKTYDATNIPLEKFCENLSSLLPRFYSIASSQLAYPHRLELTVVLVEYKKNNRIQYGTGSHFLCNLAKLEETKLAVYIQSTTDFTLPEDPTAPVIMVGPGTGVAPFRGFIQERIFKGHTGKNWLFFGERNRKYDFFYQDFWENLVATKKLHLDLAFSRDQKDKVYVQHKLLMQAQEIWRWLQEGAYFYLCGDAKQMSKDVENTLEQIICNQGQMNQKEALSYIKALKKQKRYVKEVY
ncbi:Sulfite reductase [NADPH] flavoprotein alpha-component [Candidatus Rhabdochlamydia oedothoracis]|uniref:Sulfite reductase [NADPH] flavoprotein alpha-component n=1 Tax=Candidatus Rhabdochlamydia oedothoracis TaxID=2720720 RepID=A0ABX8V3T2_9BACT|nr:MULTISPECIES: sulfite reductase [Rhabdochlamydia]KAG6559541.1 Sulfite reductase [NADPH] flavoprotein alpha-component [Candidatus Rhabdochlamydia sp. W815]QYF48237.1 Sulfite reductase [NADPH] flavoprotein alpha-component [Candidatus Rhabdochlamydia oedothoracis]